MPRGRCRVAAGGALHRFCYAAPALLDGDTPHAGPDIADQLTTERAGDPPPIPVAAAAEPVLLGGIVGEDDPCRDWPDVIRSWPPQRLIAEVATSGLLGRGGAGYPAAAKWAAAAASAPAPRYVVGNGDEGDPGSFCDRVLMEQDPHRVLAGLAYAAHAIGAGADTSTSAPSTRGRTHDELGASALLTRSIGLQPADCC